MRLQYNCINPTNLEELEYIINNSEEISATDFIIKIGNENYKALLSLPNFEIYKRGDLNLELDPYVGWYKSNLPNKKEAYYLVHSHIEYVFY